MTTRIGLENFKGLDAQYELGKLTMFVGPNMIGKTAVLDAIRFAMGAELTSSGKSNDRLARYFGEGGGSVVIEDEDGIHTAELQRRHTTVSVKRTSTAEKFPVADQTLLNVGEFMRLSDEKRRQFLLELVASGEAVPRDVAIDKLGAEFVKARLGALAGLDELRDPPESVAHLVNNWPELEDRLRAHFPVTKTNLGSDVFRELTDRITTWCAAQRKLNRDHDVSLKSLEEATRGAEITEEEIEALTKKHADLEARYHEMNKLRAEWVGAQSMRDQLKEDLENDSKAHEPPEVIQAQIDELQKTMERWRDRRIALERLRELYELSEESRPDRERRDELAAALTEYELHAEEIARRLINAVEMVLENWPGEDSLFDRAEFEQLQAQYPGATAENLPGLIAECVVEGKEPAEQRNEKVLQRNEAQQRLKWEARLAVAEAQLQALGAAPTAEEVDQAAQDARDASEARDTAREGFLQLGAWRRKKFEREAGQLYLADLALLADCAKDIREVYVKEVVDELKGDLKAGLPFWAEPYVDLENIRGRPILDLGWVKEGRRVSLEAMSGAETAFYFCALAGAIAARRQGLRRYLLLEVDALDEANIYELTDCVESQQEHFEAVVFATSRKIVPEDFEKLGWTVIELEYDDAGSEM